MAGALARYWAHGDGPSHSALSTAFALAGFAEKGEGGSKQERVLSALRTADEATGVKLVEELLGLLRGSGEFDRDDDNPPRRSLESATRRAGHVLSPDGYIDWRQEQESPKSGTDTTVRTLSRAATANQKIIIKSILDVFRDSRTWPKYGYIETIMFRRGIDVYESIREMPPAWVMPSLPGNARPQPEDEIRAGILGVYRCDGVDDLLDLFVRVIKWSVRERDAFTPAPTEYVEPEWPFNQLLNGLAPEPSSLPSLVDVVLTLELMRYEPGLPSWGGPVNDPHAWKIRIPSGIRRWRDADTMDDYVTMREKDFAPLMWSDNIQQDRARVAPAEEDAVKDMRLATVFVVHGRDAARKHEVARTLQRLTGREPVILHEHPNRGQTIIEKFETHAREVAFAVVLLTGDDVGGLKSRPEEGLRPRARQNVVFELGFFVGAIGRPRVVALYEPNVELPSDLHGVLYTELDTNGAWKTELARELEAAGVDVDLRRLLG